MEKGAEPRELMSWYLDPGHRPALAGCWPLGKFLSRKIRGLHWMNLGGAFQHNVLSSISLSATSYILLAGN